MPKFHSNLLAGIYATGINHALTYDDVIIRPSFSELDSRQDPDICSVFFGDYPLEIPIISASMSSITELDMALTMCPNGAGAIVHRFMEEAAQINMAIAIKEEFYRFAEKGICDFPCDVIWAACSFAVGVSEGERSRANQLFHKAGVRSLTIDVAHGHSQSVVDMIRWCKDHTDCYVIAGNIATAKAASTLADAGVDAVKVGIGCGSICSTRIMTGCGLPQISALCEISYELRGSYFAKARYVDKNVNIIADGGIKYPGDIVKALAAGADSVMIGRLLAGTPETPGQIVRKGLSADENYKMYRGMASMDVQLDRKKHLTEEDILQEGVSIMVPATDVSACEVVRKLAQAIRQGFSYVGAENIDQLRENAVFEQVTNSGITEAMPRSI